MKGQYFSFDAIIAAVIFVLALVALLSYWHSVRSFLDYQNDPLTKEAIRVSNLLFAPPSPSSSCDTMTKFGLARGVDDRRVDASIISCARTKTSAWLRQGLDTSYNISITITNMADGSFVTIPQAAAGAAPSAPANRVNIRRLATVVDATDGSTYLAAVDLSMYTQ